jgi:N-acetyl-anhydromuramyl-L-alanine amidase AmpD
MRRRASRPQIKDITDRLEKHVTKRYPTRTPDQIRHLVIHHSGVRASVGPDRFAQHHVQIGLPGIRYHFVIGEHGEIWQTNALTTISAHAESGSVAGVGICVTGNFITEAEPLPAQMESLARLCAWLLREFDMLPAEEVVRGRKDFAQDATDPNFEWNQKSPGTQWDTGANWKDRLIRRIHEA